MKTIYLILGLGFIHVNFVSGQGFIPDTTINQIRLLNASSIRQTLKSDTLKINLQFSAHDSTLPEIKLTNADGRQTLTMIFYPGSSKYEFSVFRLSYTESWSDNKILIKLSDKEFETEKGIKLGTLRKDVIDKMGKPTLVLMEDDTKIETIVYRIEENSSFLDRYRQFIYYDNYKIKDGKVTEIEFGFVYP